MRSTNGESRIEYSKHEVHDVCAIWWMNLLQDTAVQLPDRGSGGWYSLGGAFESKKTRMRILWKLSLSLILEGVTAGVAVA